MTKYMGYCLTSITTSGCSTAMTVLTTTSVAATYNNSISSGLGGTRVGKDLGCQCCRRWHFSVIQKSVALFQIMFIGMMDLAQLFCAIRAPEGSLFLLI
jgi:hypothetical protein